MVGTQFSPFSYAKAGLQDGRFSFAQARSMACWGSASQAFQSLGCPDSGQVSYHGKLASDCVAYQTLSSLWAQFLDY